LRIFKLGQLSEEMVINAMAGCSVQRMLSNTKIEASVVSHYLYGYQTMRLASQDEIKTFSTSATDKESQGSCNGVQRLKVSKKKQEETAENRKIKPPDGVALCISSIPGAIFGACSLKDIPVGTWFGPFEGKLVRRNEVIGGSMSESMWEIFHDGEVSHFLDGQNQNTWMSFVKCARHKKEQNMVVFQYHGCIYYRTTREIAPGSELLVWYDAKYTQFLGLPTGWNDNKSSNGKRKGIGNLTCETSRKKRSAQDGSQVPVFTQKLIESQPHPSPKKLKIQESKSYRGYFVNETKIPTNANGAAVGSGVLYPHAFNSHMTVAIPHFTPRSYPVQSMHEEHGHHVSQPFQHLCFDKWREYQDSHQCQDQRWHVEGYLKNPHFDYQHGHCRKEAMRCKNITLPHTMTQPPQIHPNHTYHQYNPSKYEDASRSKEVKEGCLPAF